MDYSSFFSYFGWKTGQSNSPQGPTNTKTHSSDVSHFSTLITELQNLILTKCSIPDLGRLSCTSRTFQDISNKSEAWKLNAEKLAPEAARYFDKMKLEDYKICVRDYPWVPLKSELNCLALMHCNPCYAAGNYLPKEFLNASQAIQNGKPETFSSGNRMGEELKGIHAPKRDNAYDFLEDCEKPDSAFRKIINCYLKDKASWTLENNDFLEQVQELSNADATKKMTGQELGEALNVLLDKVRKRLDLQRTNCKQDT